MFILHVVPIASSAKGTLTYYSSKNLERGALVEISIRNKAMTGIISHSEPASNARSDLRSSSFQLKKISKVLNDRPIARALLDLAESIEQLTLASAGALLDRFVPEWVSKSDHFLPLYEPSAHTDELSFEHLLLQASERERLTYYRTSIRNILARKKSLLLVVPTNAHIARYASFLEKGIGERMITLSSDMKPADMEKIFANLASGTGWLIIATAHSVLLPIPSLGTIIVDTEAHGGYETIKRPMMDLRLAAEARARHANIPIIFADCLLSLSHHQLLAHGGARAIRPIITRVEFPHTITVVTPANKKDTQPRTRSEVTTETAVPSKLLDPRIYSTIKELHAKGEGIMIFVARKGVAPITVCEDCATVVRSPHTEVPLVLIQHKNNKRTFRDPKTGEEFPANTVCRHCGGWRLLPLGIGTEGVAHELEEMLGIPATIIDKDHTTTPKQVMDALANWKPKKTILVANETVLPYIDREIFNIFVGSIDSLYALPTFDSSERIVRLLMRLSEHASRSFTIHTRINDPYTLQPIVRKNISRFTADELALRTTLKLPPASWQTTIRRSVTRTNLTKEHAYLERAFESWSPIITARQGDKRNLIQISAVIYTDNHPSYDEPLALRLYGLGAMYTVHIGR